MANVSQPINPVVQPPGTHQCWAAVIAMILDRQGANVIHQVISEARQGGVPMGMSGDSLDSAGGPPVLARVFGCNYTDLRSLPSLPDGNYFAAFLRSRPFGLFGQRPGYGLHAIAINRLSGDFASLSSTDAHGIDPAAGAHPFSRRLFQLVMPTHQSGAAMTAHCVIWR